MHLEMPDGRRILDFEYKRIEVSELSADEIRRAGIPELLPCLPLMKGGAQQEYVEYMAEELQRTGNTDLEVVGFAFASLAFRRSPEDQHWLLRRFRRMHDLLEDTPIMQEILSWGKEKGLEEGRQKGLEEGRQEGRLEAWRQILLRLVAARFPDLTALAKEQTALIKQPEKLEGLAVKVALAYTPNEVHLLLSSCAPKQ